MNPAEDFLSLSPIEDRLEPAMVSVTQAGLEVLKDKLRPREAG